MKIKLIYYKICEKEFRSIKSLNKFMNNLSNDKIIAGYQYKNKIIYQLQLSKYKRFINIQE